MIEYMANVRGKTPTSMKMYHCIITACYVIFSYVSGGCVQQLGNQLVQIRDLDSWPLTGHFINHSLTCQVTFTHVTVSTWQMSQAEDKKLGQCMTTCALSLFRNYCFFHC